MHEETISTSQLKYVPADIFPLIKSYTISKDDLYLTIAGTIGRAGIVPDFFDNMNLTENAVKICEIRISKLFLLKVLRSSYLQRLFNNRTNKVAQPKLAIERILSCLTPIPPLAEQQRIVDLIEKLFTQIDIIEKNQAELEQLYDDLKKKTLDLAIRGKLVPQDTSEEPASELLKRIRAEKKAQLGKKYVDSYIYKGDDNCYYEHINEKHENLIKKLPFDIPANWIWARLSDISTKIVDGDHNPPKGVDIKTEYMMISSTNINNDGIVNLDKVRYLSKPAFEIENQRTVATKGDILFTTVGSIGRSCIYSGELNICLQRSVAIITTLIYNSYLKYYLDSPLIQEYVYSKATGTAQKGFYLNQLSQLLIPIPPPEEQQRIVDKIRRMFVKL